MIYMQTNGTINTSDRNLKTNISGSDLGLNFVNSLNPVNISLQVEVELIMV